MKAPLIALVLALIAVLLLCAPPAQAEGGAHCHSACTSVLPASIGPCPRCLSDRGHGWEKAAPVTLLLVPDSSLPPSALSDAQIARTAAAMADWLNTDVLPAWQLAPVHVVAIPRGQRLPTARPWQWVVHLMASTDAWGALGYHTTSPHGVPYGEVGVADSIEQDGTWTICLSHELAEMLVNPFANRIAFAQPDKPATGWIVEVGDPVDDHAYGWGDRGAYYTVTDFVYPSEFDPGARYPFDKLHLLKAPFATTAGGYTTRFNVAMTRQPFAYAHA